MNKESQHFNQALLTAMDRYGDQLCLQVKKNQHFEFFSYQQIQTLVFRLVLFFQRQDISDGERVVIVTDSFVEWLVSYMACLLAGAIVVPLPSSLSGQMLHFVLQDSAARLVILENDGHFQNVLNSLTSESKEALPALKTILVVDGEMDEPSVAIFSMEKILSQNTLLSPEAKMALYSHAQSVASDAIASLHYVTNESGDLTGVVFEHNQYLMMMDNLSQWLIFEQDEFALSIGSWHKVPTETITFYYFLSGVRHLVLDEDYDVIIESMGQISPTMIVAAPRHFELIYQTYMNSLAQKPEAHQKVFQWALAKGKEYWAQGGDKAKESPAIIKLRQAYKRADMTFFSQIRGQFGGRLRRLYSTGASLPQDLAQFYEVIGLPVLNLYSLNEAGGFPAISQAGMRRLSSTGQVAPGFQIKIADDGEILVQGETVIRGNWPDLKHSKERVDHNGCLHTGDLGYLDDDGYLYITGRKQHLMVLSVGHKISRLVIEKALLSSPFIAQAAVFGDGKPYVSAMIVPDREALVTYFHQDEHKNSELVTTTEHPKVKALLDQEIHQINKTLDRWEQIREYSLFAQALIDLSDDHAAPAKLSRHLVAKRYAAEIEAMYPNPIGLQLDEVTQVQLEPDRLRELLQKERLLDAWMEDAGIEFIFDLAREKQIHPPSMIHICDVVASIAQIENEEKALSTALIIGEPTRIARVLRPSQVQFLRHDHIRRMRKDLITLTKLVDGLVLGYVLDKYGYVRGIHKLEIEIKSISHFLMGPQFRHHAAISKECDAIVFFVPTGGRQVRIFANGQLVGRYANGDWSPDNIPHVDQVLEELVKEKNYNLSLIQRLLRCAFQMSEQNLGAIFLLGDSNAILERSDFSQMSCLATIVSANLNDLSDHELINFAKQDGATIIDAQGYFRACMVLLRPEATTKAEIGAGQGARHSSAAKMSAETQCLAITISQDGPITIYESGRCILSL